MSAKSIEMTPHGFTMLHEEEAQAIDGGSIILKALIGAAAVAVTNALLVQFTGRNIQQWATVGVRWITRKVGNAWHLIRA